MHEKDVFRFQISVNEVQIVKDCLQIVSTTMRQQSERSLTSHTGQKLTSKALDLAAGKRNETISLEKVKDALAKQVRDNADVIAEVETVTQVDTLVSVCSVVRGKCGENTQLNARSISVLLHRSDNLDCTPCFLLLVICLDDFAESALTE